ncbi:Uncharacterised protein [Salmonella enterica subsp. enterica serovar Typhi]|nr:Uncharacterised protein [Salmonella enterica subsp. enterica serovar Typhi]
MTVSLVDKRRSGQRIPGLDLANGTWFTILDIPGMERVGRRAREDEAVYR